MRGGNDVRDEVQPRPVAYEPPAVEHREPIAEPAVCVSTGALGPSSRPSRSSPSAGRRRRSGHGRRSLPRPPLTTARRTDVPYEPPAVEHREPIREPAVLGTVRLSPTWTEADDDEEA